MYLMQIQYHIFSLYTVSGHESRPVPRNPSLYPRGVANASSSERQQALTSLQQSQFSEAEQRRLAAYEPR